MATTYELTVRTGDRSGAGTDEDVYVTLLFERGAVGPAQLDRPLRDDFEAGSVQKYPVRGPDDLGEPIALRFTLGTQDTDTLSSWCLDSVTLAHRGRRWEFPCHGWVRGGAERVLFEGAARLPQHATRQGERALRDAEVALRRRDLPWRPNDGTLPGSLDVSEARPIPLEERYRDLVDNSYELVFAKTMAAVKLTTEVLQGAFQRLDDFLDMFRAVDVPKVASTWRDDREAGRMPVQGISPVFLTLAAAPPEGMPLQPKAIDPHLEAGVDLPRAFAQKRMYAVDFAALAEVPMFTGERDGETEVRFAPPARALYFRESSGALRPMAIQLGRDPERDLVFTPSDTEWDWLAAKSFVACAEGNVHQAVTHALRTHFAMEPIVMATLRNLPSAHPVFKLLKRHLRYTLAINEGARQTLLAPGGVFDIFMATGGPSKGHVQLLTQAYARWNFADNRLPDDLARRGVDDPIALPYYPYRDDARPIWDAIARYVTDTLALFYPDDETLRGDDEMAAWWRDLTAHGLPVAKLPCAALTRVADLADILTTFVFTVSAQHAAMNYLQYEHYAFVPHAPLCMRAPPPTARGEWDEAALVAALPDRTQASWQLCIGRALASIGSDEEFLFGAKPWHEAWFADPAAAALVQRFRDEMSAHDARVRAANERRPAPYALLLPSAVPTSITI